MRQTLKILAIDREEIILKSIKKALKSNSEIEYNITTCSTALDGLKLIRSDKFDLVFLDIVLPGMNAVEVIRRIKNISSSVSLIVMSGYSSMLIHPSPADKGTDEGEFLNKAEGFLLKPFTTEEINSIISHIFRQKKK